VNGLFAFEAVTHKKATKQSSLFIGGSAREF